MQRMESGEMKVETKKKLVDAMMIYVCFREMRSTGGFPLAPEESVGCV